MALLLSHPGAMQVSWQRACSITPGLLRPTMIRLEGGKLKPPAARRLTKGLAIISMLEPKFVQAQQEHA